MEKLQSSPGYPFDFWRLSLAGSQHDIGQKLADFALNTIGLHAEAEELSTAERRSLDDIFKTYCPALSQRAEGVAAEFAKSGIQANPYSLSVVDHPQSYACSAASFAGTSGPMMIRNFDFTLRSFPELVGIPATPTRPMIDPVALMKIEPDIGRSTISLVSMDLFIGAIDGINDAGLCAALLSLSNARAAPATTRFDRFDELSVLRILLEQCASVSEAIEVFCDMPKYIGFLPCHYIVADRHGDSAILEWDAKGPHIVRAEHDGGLVCTNHHLAAQPERNENVLQASNAGSVERFEKLSNALQGPPVDPKTAWQAAELVRLNAFDANSDVFGGTLWSALYGLNPPSLQLRVLGGLEDDVGTYNAISTETF